MNAAILQFIALSIVRSSKESNKQACRDIVPARSVNSL